MTVRIGIIGDYDEEFEPLPATNVALGHSLQGIGVQAECRWVPTEQTAEWSDADVASWSGLIVGPGSPLKNPKGRAYRDHLGVLGIIRLARESGIPTLATCAGFQHVALEYLRNVVGIADATASYYDDGGTPVIALLACSLRGLRLPVLLKERSRARESYATDVAEERYFCRFGIREEFHAQLNDAGLSITGVDGNDGDARILELTEHPFFVATCFVPQVQSTPEIPHPLFQAFVRAAARRATVGV